jgi:hypothetical protein
MLIRIYYLLLLMSAFPLHTMMLFNSLHEIEKQLVIRTIQQRGIATIYNEIQRISDQQFTFEGDERDYTKPITFNIDTIFSKSESNRDPLTQAVFDKIADIESKYGYIPEAITTATQDSTQLATNHFGNSTYYWIDSNTIRIESCLNNKPELLALINTYKNTKQ